MPPMADRVLTYIADNGELFLNVFEDGEPVAQPVLTA